MPIYEYKCEVCHTRFEQYVRSMSACVQIACPNCGAENAKKEWSVFGLGKGSGASISDTTSTACAPAST
jgi:putative FmdB family regulatory protein